MSALIRSLVLKKRAAQAERALFQARRDQIVSEAKGEKGDPGEQGPMGPMPAHEWRGTKLRFEKPGGKWGPWVDLKGNPGKDGKQIVVAGGGGGRFDPAALAPLPDAPATGDFLILERDGHPYRVSIQQLQSLLGGAGLPSGAVTVNGEAVTVNGQFVVMN